MEPCVLAPLPLAALGLASPFRSFSMQPAARRGDVPIQRARYSLQEYCHVRDAFSPSPSFHSLRNVACLPKSSVSSTSSLFQDYQPNSLCPLCSVLLRVPSLTAGAAVTRRAVGWCNVVPQGSPVEDALIPGPSFSAACSAPTIDQHTNSICAAVRTYCVVLDWLESFVEYGGGHDAGHVSSRDRSQQDIGYNHDGSHPPCNVVIIASHTSLSSSRLSEPQARPSCESWNGLPRGRVECTTGAD